MGQSHSDARADGTVGKRGGFKAAVALRLKAGITGKRTQSVVAALVRGTVGRGGTSGFPVGDLPPPRCLLGREA